MKKTDWSQPLRNRLAEDYFLKMIEFINQTYQEGKVYPPENQIFRAIELTPLAQTKVIIVGQDPYPQPGKAQGLAFSYPATFKVNRQITPFMLNHVFCTRKRPPQPKTDVCIAFWGISTHQPGHLLPESLQRFRVCLRGLFGAIRFRLVFASCGLFRYLAPPFEAHPIR